ncbi:MAG: peptidase M28 family protein [Chitinophagaceae bacterium]|nr:MAG: peptidase M28 family protein [Chitinophagaceae bacterium]
MRKILATIVGFMMAVAAGAQQDDSLFIKKISDEILLNGKAYDQLRELTKNIGQRLAGSAAMVKAENWGLALMQSTGADKAWLQECMVPHWVRGGKDQLDYTPRPGNAAKKKRSLDVIALGNSMGTGPAGITSTVIEIGTFAELEQKKDLVKGKIVFFNYKFRKDFIKTFDAYGDAVRYRGGGPSAAAKYGAKAVIVRSMSMSTDNVPHTGGTSYDSAYTKIPAVAIGLMDADWLSSTLAKEPVMVTMKTNGHFLPDTIGHNVIGELRGSEFPDQVITIGGHLDSWDIGEGAHDDGTGCVQTVEMLRTFQALGYKPKHTIRFVLFANEENGTRGGKKYAEEAKAKNEKQVFALESDDGGFTPRGFGLTMSDEQFKKVSSWLPLLAPYGTSYFSKGGGGSDINPLNTTLQTPLAGFEPDTQRYFDLHHTRADVFENVNKRELLLGAVNMTALIYLVDKYGL